MSDESLDIRALRAEIARAAGIGDLAERTLEIVAVIEAVSTPLGIHPVVVGGMAVYFWTASNKFVTYDIDVVMDVPDALARRLGELGFVRAADGRHWMLPDKEYSWRLPARVWTPARSCRRSSCDQGEAQRCSLASMCYLTAWTSFKPQAMRRQPSRRSRCSRACLKTKP